MFTAPDALWGPSALVRIGLNRLQRLAFCTIYGAHYTMLFFWQMLPFVLWPRELAFLSQFWYFLDF